MTLSHFATHGGTVNTFDSRFAISDEVVVLNNHYGEVVAVRFTDSKVLYDVHLHVGGETLRDVDSTFVDAAEDEYDEFRPIAPIFGPGGAVDLGPLIGNAKTEPPQSWSGACPDPYCVVCRALALPLFTVFS